MEQIRFTGLEVRLAELGRSGSLDSASEIARHELHAVADAEGRNPEREDVSIDLGRAIRVDRSRATREDERYRITCGDLVGARAGEPTSSE